MSIPDDSAYDLKTAVHTKKVTIVDNILTINQQNTTNLYAKKFKNPAFAKG